MSRRRWLRDQINGNRWKIGAELGLWDGRTYCFLLKHCPDLTLIGVDVWEATDNYRDWNHASNEKKTRNGAAKYGDRSILYKDLTVYAAERVEDGSLDFVFIDADHSTEAVKADIAAWKPKLRSGGMLSGHDIDWPSVQAALQDVDYEIGPDNVWYA